MYRKSGFLILLIICAAALGYAVCRDIRIEKQYYGSDLRNRVVGARLIKDGQAPYFYKWRQADGVRYYDPDNDNTDNNANGRLSVITATPFFHHLLYPIADWPQSRIFAAWLIMEYLAWLGLTLFFFLSAQTSMQKAAVLTVAVLFLYTEAWYMHTLYGQYYLFLPLLALLCYRLLQSHRHWLMAIAAGLVAVALVLIRPNFVLFFLPFLWTYKRYARSWLMAFFIPVLLLAGWTILSKNERSLWQQYAQAVSLHSATHQRLQPFVHSTGRPAFDSWEGITTARMNTVKLSAGENENGNFFLLVRKIYKPGMGVLTLQILSLCGILALLLAFFLRHRDRSEYSLPQLAMLGYSLYMVSDLFSPVYRWQYYTVQWIFPLLLAASVYDRRDKAPFLWLLAGLGLNVINTSFTGLEHTLGEYFMLAALISLSFSRKRLKQGLLT